MVEIELGGGRGGGGPRDPRTVVDGYWGIISRGGGNMGLSLMAGGFDYWSLAFVLYLSIINRD